MDVNILLSEGPVLPCRTVPVLAPVVDISAINIANILVLERIEGQLGLVRTPCAIIRVVVRESAEETIGALVHSGFDHEVGRESPDFVVESTAAAIGVHGVSAEQDIKGCELEWIHIHSQRHFNKNKMECEPEATENFTDELRIR